MNRKSTVFIDQEGLKVLINKSNKFINLIVKNLSSVLQSYNPNCLTMLSIETYDKITGICAIVALVYISKNYLGRQEKLSNCIYNDFIQRMNEIVIINDVRNYKGYLCLDNNVKSEAFLILHYNHRYNIIINSEFSVENISQADLFCFEQLTKTIKSIVYV
jgi:hypothetical protein